MYNVLSRKITCQWLLNSTEFSKSLENVYGWYMLVCFCLFWCCYPTVLWMISQYDYVTWKYHSSEPALPSPPNPSMPVDFLPPSNEMQYSNVLRATPALGVAPGARMEPRGKWFSLVKKNECESHAVLWQWNDTYIHRKCDWVKFLLKFRKWNSFAINVRNINPLTFDRRSL